MIVWNDNPFAPCRCRVSQQPCDLFVAQPNSRCSVHGLLSKQQCGVALAILMAHTHTEPGWMKGSSRRPEERPSQMMASNFAWMPSSNLPWLQFWHCARLEWGPWVGPSQTATKQSEDVWKQFQPMACKTLWHPTISSCSRSRHSSTSLRRCQPGSSPSRPTSPTAWRSLFCLSTRTLISMGCGDSPGFWLDVLCFVGTDVDSAARLPQIDPSMTTSDPWECIVLEFVLGRVKYRHWKVPAQSGPHVRCPKLRRCTVLPKVKGGAEVILNACAPEPMLRHWKQAVVNSV